MYTATCIAKQHMHTHTHISTHPCYTCTHMHAKSSWPPRGGVWERNILATQQQFKPTITTTPLCQDVPLQTSAIWLVYQLHTLEPPTTYLAVYMCLFLVRKLLCLVLVVFFFMCVCWSVCHWAYQLGGVSVHGAPLRCGTPHSGMPHCGAMPRMYKLRSG